MAARDFATFGEIVEHEAMEVHAIMMSGQPSAFYMQPDTVRLIHSLRAFREETGVPVYFTLDAGPNLHVLCSVHVHVATDKSIHAIARNRSARRSEETPALRLCR